MAIRRKKEPAQKRPFRTTLPKTINFEQKGEKLVELVEWLNSASAKDHNYSEAVNLVIDTFLTLVTEGALSHEQVLIRKKKLKKDKKG